MEVTLLSAMGRKVLHELIATVQGMEVVKWKYNSVKELGNPEILFVFKQRYLDERSFRKIIFAPLRPFHF